MQFDKITARISRLSRGKEPLNVDSARVAQVVIHGMFDGVSTVDLDNLAAEAAASLITLHSDYALLAARIVISNLHKQTEKRFSHVVKALYECWNERSQENTPVVSEELYNVVVKHAEVLDAAIQYDRDYDLSYFGVRTLERSYLLRINNKISERPQHLLMRTAIGVHGDNLPKILESYELMSRRYFTHASPTLFNAGTVRPQMSSCFLVAMKEDSLDGIYDTLKTCAMISKYAGGVGLHVHNIRAAGTYIVGTNGTSTGVIPMLKVYNATARYADQGGSKRPGAFAIYLEPWHSDIFEFLDIRKNYGNEEMRARDLFTALWIPDYFMHKVKHNLSWCLFSPNEAPGLIDTYGEEFEELYDKYEAENRFRKKVKAQELWAAIVSSQIETGGPFILFKDACNLKSNQSNLGTIKSSNLCTEIVQYSSPDEVAVCNLASLALPKFVDQNKHSTWFDFQALHRVTKVVLRNLDAIIDQNWYPVPEAERNNKRHRPVAIGVQGFADMLLSLRLPYESEETKRLNAYVFETIYHGALEASVELAKKNGPYETFKGSPASKGLLQFDLWDGSELSGLWDWDKLKADMKKYGLRNSLVTALMPTASTSQILGFNECFEPYTSNIYTRRVLAGEFQVINPWLLKDLSGLGLWNEQMKTKILRDRGSIQNIACIPDELKQLYKTIWEISQRDVINLAVGRAPFIDQSQSMNLYLKDPTQRKISSMHFHSWDKGLKTGMYYLRTEAAADPTQFTVAKENAEMEQAFREIPVPSMDLLDIRPYKEVEVETGIEESGIIAVDPETELLKVLRSPNLLGHAGFSREEPRSYTGHYQTRRPSSGGRKRSRSEDDAGSRNGSRSHKQRYSEPSRRADKGRSFSFHEEEDDDETDTSFVATENTTVSPGSDSMAPAANGALASVRNPAIDDLKNPSAQCTPGSSREASCDMCSG